MDVTSRAWASEWYWSVLGPDWYSPPDMWLDQTAITHNGVTYYRPHLAAGQSLLANPNWAHTRSVLSASDSRRKPGEFYQDILRAGRGIDEAIAELTGNMPLPGYPLSFRSVF